MTQQQRYTIEEGPLGPLMTLRSTWSDSLAEEIDRLGVVGLRLNYAWGWSDRDISFLAKVPNLQYLFVLDYLLDDLDPIHGLSRLRSLDIYTYSKTTIDFRCFPDLVECGIECNKALPTLTECTKLQYLFTNRWKGKSLEELQPLAELRTLRMKGARSLRSLVATQFPHLDILEVGLATKLESLSGIETQDQLQFVDFDTCKKINTLTPLSALIGLVKLLMRDCGTVLSLRPLEKLPQLALLALGDTIVEDGQLCFLRSMPALRGVSGKNRRHYDCSPADLPNEGWDEVMSRVERAREMRR